MSSPGGGEHVELTGSMHDESIARTLEAIEHRIESVDDEFKQLAATAKVTGKAVKSGMDDAAEGAENVKRESSQAVPPVKELGDEAAKTGAKARAGASGLDRFARKARRAARNSRGLGGILMAYKLAAVVVGITALAGGMSALAAGAGMAIGYLAPMLGVLLGLGPLGLAAALGLWAYKAAAEALTGPANTLKAQFDGIGEAVARGGLSSGLMSMAKNMGGLGNEIRKGMGGIGGVLGQGAREAGKWASSASMLSQVNRIFAGLTPILAALLRVIVPMGDALLDVIESTMPLSLLMAKGLGKLAQAAAEWTEVQRTSGRMTAWLLKGWERAEQVGGALLDFLIGFYTILKVGAGYAGDMGRNLSDAAASFRDWTTSAEGQARINKYFADSLPTLREVGLLLAAGGRALGTLGGNPNIAPLLALIRTELGPALGALVNQINGEGGLGPALIHATAALANFLASLDFSALTQFAMAFAQIINGLTWLIQNVPGANVVMSALLFSFLGFKVVGAVWGVVAKGAAAFSWMSKALTLTTGLSLGQKAFGLVVKGLGSAFKWFGGIAVTVIRAVGLAFMANPIIAAIVIIIGALILLYTKCEWFRNAVHAVLDFIAKYAIVAWGWIQKAFSATVEWIVSAAKWLWENGLKPTWEIISTAVRMYVMAWYYIVKTVVEWIVSAAKWLWENGLKPTWEAIAAGAEVAWGIIKWIVQAVVWYIALNVAILAKICEVAWSAIAAAGRWVWENVLGPVVRWFVGIFSDSVGWVSQKWTEFVSFLQEKWRGWSEDISRLINGVQEKWAYFTTALGLAWQLFYSTYIEPKINAIREKWDSLVAGITHSWDAGAAWISDKWNWVKTTASDFIAGIRSDWESCVIGVRDFFAPIAEKIGTIWDNISTAASKAAEVVRGAWEKAVSIVKGAWNTIAGGWNSIPSITVPDWVPGMGGQTFSMPKLPTLWHGGPTPGGPALVGEHGPEPLVRGGRIVDILGARGPEVRDLPRGGYVVPNLSTLASLPGLARSIPGSVAAAIAGSATRPAAAGGGGQGELLTAISELTAAVRANRPINVNSTGDDTEQAVLAALRELRREENARGRYSYVAGKG